MSLQSRLARARLALHVRAEQTAPDLLQPILLAGIDLVVLGASDDVEADVEAVRRLRDRWVGQPLLVATDGADVAAPAAVDVAHVRRPGWKLWGDYPRGHEWSLLGRDVRDARTIGRPGRAWDYLFVGPVDPESGDEPLVEAGVRDQEPFAPDALPWFALGDFTAGNAAGVLGLGARRLALGPDVVDAVDAAGRVTALRKLLDATWQADERSGPYLMAAMSR